MALRFLILIVLLIIELFHLGEKADKCYYLKCFTITKILFKMEALMLEEILKRDDFRCLSFWSWNGDMKADEVREQIRGFAKQGLGGFFMHSRAGLSIDYLGEEWFSACEIALDEAQKLNLSVWIYDEDGWPSGFAGGIVPRLGLAYQLKRLLFCRNKAEANANTDHFIAAFREKEANQFSRIDFSSTKEDDLFCYYIVDEHYVDLLYADVTNKFIESTHEKYKQHFAKYFGSTIIGIFTDEPQLNSGGLPWSFSLPLAFEQLFNKNIVNELWKLKIDGEGFEEFRHDFWKTVSSLLQQNFSKRIGDWCSDNNLHFTGHYAAEDGLCDQITSNANVMPNYEFMSLPGIDHLGKRLASPVLLKQVSSVARQFDYKRILSESYGCAGWDISFSDMAWIGGWQAAFGVNLMCLHLSAYSIKGRRKRDYPAFYSYQEPWWDEFHFLAKYLSGLDYTLTKGNRMVDFLVLNPMTSLWCKFMPGYNSIVKNISSQYRLLIENLIDVQIDFDIGDEDLLANHAYIENHKIKINNCSYSVLIIPEATSLEKSTVDLMTQFAKSGGKIIFANSRPYLVDGKVCQNDNEIQNICAIDIQNRRDIWKKSMQVMNYERNLVVCGVDCLTPTEDIITHFRKENDTYIAFVFNPKTDATKHVFLKAIGENRIFEIDPNTLKQVEQMASFDGEYTQVKLNLNPKQSNLYEIKPGVSLKNKYHVNRTINLCDFNIELSDYNSLTIDYCKYSINGNEFTVERPVVCILDDLYADVHKLSKNTEVIIRYRFQANFDGKIPNFLQLAIENQDCNQIRFNGIEISDRYTGWWIDKCIGLFDVKDIVVESENIVELFYEIPIFDNIPDSFELI